MKPQSFHNCGGPWCFLHFGFFANHLKLVNSISVLVLIYRELKQAKRIHSCCSSKGVVKIWKMMNERAIGVKGYVHYKTITSQNVSYETQIKNFFIL